MENVYKPKDVICILKFVFASMIIVGSVASYIIIAINYEEVALWLFVIVTFCICYGLIIGIRLIVALACKKIVIGDDTVRVREDRRGGFRVLQHAVNLSYTEIKDMKLIIAATDTNGEEQFGLVTPMPNIYFECTNANFKMINVYDYSKKQVIDILNEIRKRAQIKGCLMECSSGEEIFQACKDFYHNKKNKTRK